MYESTKNVGRKFTMKKILCIVLVLALAAVAVYFGVQSNKTNTQLTAVQAELETAKADLEAAKTELEAAAAAAAELETVKAKKPL